MPICHHVVTQSIHCMLCAVSFGTRGMLTQQAMVTRLWCVCCPQVPLVTVKDLPPGSAVTDGLDKLSELLTKVRFELTNYLRPVVHPAWYDSQLCTTLTGPHVAFRNVPYVLLPCCVMPMQTPAKEQGTEAGSDVLCRTEDVPSADQPSSQPPAVTEPVSTDLAQAPALQVMPKPQPSAGTGVVHSTRTQHGRPDAINNV